MLEIVDSLSKIPHGVCSNRTGYLELMHAINLDANSAFRSKLSLRSDGDTHVGHEIGFFHYHTTQQLRKYSVIFKSYFTIKIIDQEQHKEYYI